MPHYPPMHLPQMRCWQNPNVALVVDRKCHITPPPPSLNTYPLVEIFLTLCDGSISVKNLSAKYDQRVAQSLEKITWKIILPSYI